MPEAREPLVVQRRMRSDGLLVVRQSPPAGTASFSATYVAPAGYGYDPGRREGLAEVTSLLLPSGAGRWDRVQLARLLDRLGASLTSHCDPESAEVTVWGPASAAPILLDVLAASVLRPRLGSVDLGRVQRQMLERQLRESTQPGDRAERELFEGIFPSGHPYRETGLGSRKSVAGLRRSEVVRFHREHFTPDGALLVVTTPLSLDAVERAAKARFRDFGQSKSPARPRIPPASRRLRAARRVRMAGRSQVEIRIGGSSLPRSDPAFSGLFLANEALGGRPLMNRLFQRVRESQGLAYHSSSHVESMRWGGYWCVQAGTGPERADQVVRLLREELDRITGENIPKPELERTRESAIGHIPLQLETTSGAHQLALELAYHDLPDDFYRTWPAELRALTPSDVRRAVEAGLDAHQSTTVLAGPVA